MATAPRIIDLRQGHQMQLKYSGFLLTPADKHFIVTSAKRFGISQGEFLRRLIHDSRMKALQCGLYRMPDEL